MASLELWRGPVLLEVALALALGVSVRTLLAVVTA
jgi:hypothetical protein